MRVLIIVIMISTEIIFKIYIKVITASALTLKMTMLSENMMVIIIAMIMIMVIHICISLFSNNTFEITCLVTVELKSLHFGVKCR